MKAYRHLIKHALKDPEVFLNVHDGECWVACKRDSRKAVQAIESVEEASLSVRRRLPAGSQTPSECIGRFLCIPGLDPDECVADFSNGEFAAKWWDLFNSTASL